MRGLRFIWRLLTHPALSAVGNAVLLLTLISPALLIVGWVIEQPLLFAIALAVLLIDSVLIGRSVLQHRNDRADGRSSDLSVGERRERLDSLLYPPRNDRRELGEECAVFAMKMRVFNEEQEWRREKAIARSAEGLREASPELDPFKARKDAETHFQRTVEAAYGFEMREEGLRLFDSAREEGAIEAKSRRMVDRPLAVEMGEIPNLFVVLARRLDAEVPSSYSATPPPPNLADELDDLMRVGVDLVEELDVSAKPERTPAGHWKLEGGGAPDERWEKAEEFASKTRGLLLSRHPALLTVYRGGYNAHVKKEQDDRSADDPAADKRPTAKKLLDLANFERSGPRRVVEANLEGLAASRLRLNST